MLGLPASAQAAAPTVANGIPDQAAAAGTAFSYAFPANTFADADGDTLTYTATKSDDSALPSWLSFTASTRTFSGTPAASDTGTLSVKVTADDGNDGTVSDTFAIKVGATNVCLRTPAVRDTIVTKVEGVTDCVAVTAAHLAAITDNLDLRNKNLTSLKAIDFGGLTGLTQVWLNENKLTTLPDDLFDHQLMALIWIELTDNDLTSLPDDVFDPLTALTGLLLDDNDLTSLPNGIFDSLTALTRVSLSNNDLTTLPAGIFDRLTALTTLSLNGNDLTALPDGIFDRLTALRNLSLNGNDLTDLPAGIFDWNTALFQLSLNDNDLTDLPAGIFDRTPIQRLFLQDNDLTSLPDDIFEPLTALQDLSLQDNTGAPFSPVVSAGDDLTVASGASVTLSGTATGPWGGNVRWQWTQVDGASSTTAVTGANAVTLTGANRASVSFTAPGAATTLHFMLVARPVPVSRSLTADSGKGRGASAPGRVTVTVDATAPTLTAAAVDGTSLVITFTEDLAAAANLANSAFTVKKTPAGGGETTVSLTGSPTLNGNTVTLTLASAVVPTDTGVKISYTKPTTGSNNRLEDVPGNAVASFPDRAVTNNTTVTPQDPDARRPGKPRWFHVAGWSRDVNGTPTHDAIALWWVPPADSGDAPVDRYQYRTLKTTGRRLTAWDYVNGVPVDEMTFWTGVTWTDIPDGDDAGGSAGDETRAVITGLETGVEYFVQLRAYTSGTLPTSEEMWQGVYTNGGVVQQRATAGAESGPAVELPAVTVPENGRLTFTAEHFGGGTSRRSPC